MEAKTHQEIFGGTVNQPSFPGTENSPREAEEKAEMTEIVNGPKLKLALS